MVRIAWRDLAGWAHLEETLADLTAFADAAIGTACEFARRPLVARYGEPCSESGVVQPLVVVGMGKLGGGELNFSSDVDLVLLFPEYGETNGPRSIANEEFFTRLGQGLVRMLETPTPDGIVLRVDLRLRPFGDSGPLVASFASFEDYLPRHGRDWERYAYVKARAITARREYEEIEASAIRPFVYRRYLDFGVFESLQRNEGADCARGRAPRACGSREARARRHPRDRIHRPVVPTHSGRPRSAIADSVVVESLERVGRDALVAGECGH